LDPVCFFRDVFHVTTRWANAAGSSEGKRYYAFVRVADHDLAELLVSNGLARVYGEANTATNRAITAKLKTLEADAQTNKRGAWALAPAIPQMVEADTGYRLSGSGVRHNAKCRYYASPSATPCSPTAGKPCKMCGGGVKISRLWRNLAKTTLSAFLRASNRLVSDFGQSGNGGKMPAFLQNAGAFFKYAGAVRQNTGRIGEFTGRNCQNTGVAGEFTGAFSQNTGRMEEFTGRNCQNTGGFRSNAPVIFPLAAVGGQAYTRVQETAKEHLGSDN